MTAQTHGRLVLIGFLLMYFAGMGALLVASSPLFDSIRSETEWYVMLPTGSVGVILSIFAYLFRM